MEATTKDQLPKMHKLVLAVLDGGGLTIAEVKKAVPCGETTARTALNDMLALGHVTKSSGTPAVWEAVRTPEPEKPAKAAGSNAASSQPGKASKGAEVAQARDSAVLASIAEAGIKGKTRDQVAEDLGLSPSLTYLSMWRLQRDGRIELVLSGRRAPNYCAVKEVK